MKRKKDISYTIVDNGKLLNFNIGEPIITNELAGEYRNLIGYLEDVKIDSEKDTDNCTDDLYIYFDEPNKKTKKRLEKDFARLYGKEVLYNDLGLDEVVVAPFMVQPLKNIVKKKSKR